MPEPTEKALEEARKWLEACPGPRDRGKRRFDIFISYRSVDRTWALALRDALKQKGYEVFLDQYELAPGQNLNDELMEALRSSGSGVLIWSKKAEGSRWVTREYQAIDLLRKDPNREPPFKLVIASLDGTELPEDLRGELYVDFRDYPDGPRGVELVRLFHATQGLTMSDEALALARAHDEQMGRELKRISGWSEAGQPDAILRRSRELDAAWLSTPQVPVAAAQALISMGASEEALEVLAGASSSFPNSLRIQQLRALTHRRRGAAAKKANNEALALDHTLKAITIGGELLALDKNEPETLGILAAALTQRWELTGEIRFLAQAQSYYEHAFERTSSDYYTGINAASKAVMLGDKSRASRLANKVFSIVQHADRTDFWACLTKGEAQLLQGQHDDATSAYREAITFNASRTDDIRSALAQIQRLAGPLGLTDDQKRNLLKPFSDILGESLDSLIAGSSAS